MSENLIGLNAISSLIQLVIWTGQLRDERPVSMIIVAEAGAGKTSLLQMEECSRALFVGDITARTITGIINDNKFLTHVMLGDMLSIFGHKKATVELTLRLLSQMTGEVLKHDPWTGKEMPPRKIGLITAIPPEDFKKQINYITGGGFASRFLIARYKYTDKTIEGIHEFIAANGYAEKVKHKVAIPDNDDLIKDGKLPLIQIGKRVSIKIKELGREDAVKNDPLGFRAHRHMRALVKAETLRSGCKVAEERHFNQVKAYWDFFKQGGREV